MEGGSVLLPQPAHRSNEEFMIAQLNPPAAQQTKTSIEQPPEKRTFQMIKNDKQREVIKTSTLSPQLKEVVGALYDEKKTYQETMDYLAQRKDAAIKSGDIVQAKEIERVMDALSKLERAKTMQELQNVCKDIGISFSDMAMQTAQAQQIGLDMMNALQDVLKRMNVSPEEETHKSLDEYLEKNGESIKSRVDGGESPEMIAKAVIAELEAKRLPIDEGLEEAIAAAIAKVCKK